MREINLKATEYFEAVARHGTVAKAAEELGISPSAVSQQVRALEAQLGVLLFRREKRRLHLTIEGDRLYQTAFQAFAALRNTRTAIGRQIEQRSLNLRVGPSFGVRWLGPRITAFADAHPEWNIRIDASPEFTTFETELVDADLRYGTGAWAGLSVERMMNDLVLPMCSPSYLERLRDISSDPAEQIANARLIESVKMLYRWDFWLAANKIDIPGLVYPFRFDRSSMSIEIAKQGGGVALDSASLCLSELERGELVPLCPDYAVIDFAAYWFVCPRRHHNRRIVKHVHDWLMATCEDHELRLRGFLTRRGCSFRQVDPSDLLGGLQP